MQSACSSPLLLPEPASLNKPDPDSSFPPPSSAVAWVAWVAWLITTEHVAWFWHGFGRHKSVVVVVVLVNVVLVVV